MEYRKPTPLPSLTLPIDMLLRSGDARTLKKVLVDYGLLDGFADYLIQLFTDNALSANSTTAAIDLAELVHEFVDNRDQQQAVVTLLPKTESSDCQL